MVPSDIPGKMDPVTVTESGTNVVLTWTAPDDHSSTITAYDIQFLKSDGTYGSGTGTCDGTDATLLTCSMAMNDVETLTGLAVDSLIQVKMRAENANGWGDYSELNVAGALIKGAPSQMAAPTFDLTQSSATNAYVEWTALTGTAAGGTGVTISSYELDYYNTGDSTWYNIYTGTNLYYSHTGLTASTTYSYRVRAVNAYGNGAYSTTASVFTAQ